MFKTQNLYQNDEKWKNTKLGNSSETIGGWGCLLTSVTMMLNGIGYNETPETVNQKMKSAGGFQGAFFIPSVLPYVWPNCSYRDMQPCEGSVPVSQIDAAVAAGKPVVLQVDWNQQAGIQTHFVLVKEKKGNDYVIYDPYKYGGDGPDKEVLLTSRYKHNGAIIDKEISGVLWFDSYSASPPEPPKVKKVPLPAEKYILYAAEDDLALRAEPSVSGYLWKRMVLGTELISLEPTKASAQAKLGKQGEWISVQDPKGDQGFVAAWYVSDTKGKPVSATSTTSTSKPVSANTSTSSVPPGALVFLPKEELSLRSRPDVSATRIRIVPVTEQLVSLEPAETVMNKVPVNGQWLKVRDSKNREGYVAAWYVKYAGGSTAQIAAATTSGTPVSGGPLKVRATAEALAFRRQPIINESNIIRRVAIGTEFTVTEPNGEAKIGNGNEWLKVKDSTGTEGFVNAFFVTP